MSVNNTNKQRKGNKPRLAPKKGSRKASKGNFKDVKVSNSMPNYVPISMAPKKAMKQPLVNGKRVHTITHKEFISALSVNQVFSIIGRFRMNPGSSSTFPWLSGVAVNFETYRFRKLHFIYVTRTGSTTVGTIIFAPDYDAEDAQYQTESQLANNSDSRECPLWSNLTIPMDPARMNASYKQHYVMSDSRFASTSQDTKTVDVGSFQIGAESPTPGAHGRLWVDYSVELFTPQVATENSALQGGGSIDIAALNAAAPTAFITGAPTINTLTDIIDYNANGLGVAKTFPTNVLGTMLKDYQGLFNNVFGGTGMTVLPSLEVNGFLDAAKATTVGTSGIINTPATIGVRPWKVNLQRGDILSFTPTLAATTLTSLHNDVAGAEFAELL